MPSPQRLFPLVLVPVAVDGSGREAGKRKESGQEISLALFFHEDQDFVSRQLAQNVDQSRLLIGTSNRNHLGMGERDRKREKKDGQKEKEREKRKKEK